MLMAMYLDGLYDEDQRTAFIESMRGPVDVAEAQDRSVRDWARSIGIALPPGV